MHMTRYGFLALVVCGAALAGNLTDRARLTLDRVLAGGPPRYTEELVLADAVPRHVRRFSEFSGDVSGRYIEALSVWARSNPAARAPLDAVVTKLLACQKDDGHFGDAFDTAEATDADMAILWGNGSLSGCFRLAERMRPTLAVSEVSQANSTRSAPRTWTAISTVPSSATLPLVSR
jgi:hypothetical protein